MKTRLIALTICVLTATALFGSGYGTHGFGPFRVDNTTGLVTTGAFGTTVVTKVAADSPYTVADGVSTVAWNATDGDSIVNIPDATGSGRILNVTKTDTSTNTVTLNPQGGSTIDGAGSQVIIRESIEIQDIDVDTWIIR